MTSRRALLLAACALFGAPVGAGAQLASAKIPRVGVLTLRSRGHSLEAAFVAGMKALGYVDGRNVALEWRFADGRAEKLPALAAELVGLRVDVIVAASTQAIRAAAEATKIIPIVFPANADPVGGGFVGSLSRPGGNVTGLSTIAADLGPKQIELLKAIVPRAARIGVLVNPTNSGSALVLKNFEASARGVGVSVLRLEAQTAGEIERAFAAMASSRADAVTVAIDGIFIEATPQIAALALKQRLPFISTQQLDAEAGALMSYGHSLAENYRRAAVYVDKVLKGTHPRDLPIEQPMTLELVLNLKTAKALGIKVPQSVLARADRVIE